MTGDYPRVLYHLVGVEHAPDLASPNYPVAVSQSPDLHGRRVGHGSAEHIIPQHHYRTMLLEFYLPNGTIDEETCKKEEERLATKGWVRHPDMLNDK